MACESVLKVKVLARPGTPSSRMCPLAKSPTRMRSTVSSWPTMTRATSRLSSAAKTLSSATFLLISFIPACMSPPSGPSFRVLLGFLDGGFVLLAQLIGQILEIVHALVLKAAERAQGLGLDVVLG